MGEGMRAPEPGLRGDSWAAGVTLKAIRDGGVTWSIAVPATAEGEVAENLSTALDRAVDEALRVHRRLLLEVGR
jgi:hypothetical protein